MSGIRGCWTVGVLAWVQRVPVTARWQAPRRSIGGGRKCAAVTVRGQHGEGRLGRLGIPGVAGEDEP